MVKPTCHTCVFAYWDKGLWLRTLWSGFACRPACANHPDTPGLMREIPPGKVCRNYRARPPSPDPADETVKRIPLSGGLYAYVDAADYERLSRHKWRVCAGYAARYEKGRAVFMHHEIIKPPKGMVIDHRNGNRLDNTARNLHACTRGENTHNSPKRAGAISRFKGVVRNGHGRRWYATLTFKGEVFRLGSFGEEIEAARAYDYRAVECGGQDAWVNLPDEWPPERRRKVHASWKRKMARQKATKAKAKGKRKAGRIKASARKGRKRPTRDSKRPTKQSSRTPRRRKPAVRRH